MSSALTPGRVSDHSREVVSKYYGAMAFDPDTESWHVQLQPNSIDYFTFHLRHGMVLVKSSEIDDPLEWFEESMQAIREKVRDQS